MFKKDIYFIDTFYVVMRLLLIKKVLLMQDIILSLFSVKCAVSFDFISYPFNLIASLKDTAPLALCCKVIEVLYCCCLLNEKIKPIMLSFCFCFPISGPISVGHYPSIYVALQDIKSVESKVLAGICQNEKVAD